MMNIHFYKINDNTEDVLTMEEVKSLSREIYTYLILQFLSGLPMTCIRNGVVISPDREINKSFFIGHETGHHFLNHLENEKGRVLNDIQKEMEADEFAILNGYASAEEAIKTFKIYLRLYEKSNIILKFLNKKAINSINKRIDNIKMKFK